MTVARAIVGLTALVAAGCVVGAVYLTGFWHGVAHESEEKTGRPWRSRWM